MKKVDTQTLEAANNAGLKLVKEDIFVANDGTFYKLASLATDNGKTKLGYSAVRVPDPSLDAGEQFGEFTEIYGDDVCCSAIVKSVVISKQAADRKRATGNDKKMPEHFRRQYFDNEFVMYLKNGGAPLSMKEVDELAQAEWDKKNPVGESDATTVWF